DLAARRASRPRLRLGPPLRPRTAPWSGPAPRPARHRDQQPLRPLCLVGGGEQCRAASDRRIGLREPLSHRGLDLDRPEHRLSRGRNHGRHPDGARHRPSGAARRSRLAARARRRDPMSRSYVPRDGEMLVQPPVDITVSMHSFVAAASWAPLVRLCDEQLNLGGTTTYVPLGPFVVFYCAEMDNIVKQGSIEERDFGVWVPVVACERAGGIPVPRRFLTFTPYVWVSNSPA